MDFRFAFLYSEIIEIPNVVTLALMFEMNDAYLSPKISTSNRDPANDLARPKENCLQGLLFCSKVINIHPSSTKPYPASQNRH